MKILESAENYLETILMIKKQKGMVRAVDIAHTLEFSKASVSVAMKNLKEKNLIVVGEDNAIDLTPEGQVVADKMYERHLLLSKALMAIGVPEDIASADACKIEHIISPETVECLKAYMAKLES